MANVKISDLTAYTDPVATDVLPIVDLVNDQTKKVKVEDLLKKFGSGTEALPSFAFTGDLDTGIYSPGANQFAVSTGGTQRLLIDASGNTTIQGDLTVNGTTTTIESTTLSIDDKNIELGTVSTPSDTTADGGGITLKGATDKTINWVQSTGCWTFNQPTNFNNHVRIDSSGRVGIGTTSPDALLNISSTGNGYRFKIDDTTNDHTVGLYSDSTTPRFVSVNNAENSYQPLTLSGSDLRFWIGSNEKARIDSSGRLLLGTTTEGDGQADNLTIADSANCGVTIRSGTSNKGQIYFSDSTSGAGESIGRLVYSHSDNSMRFNTNSSERMRIDSSGNVGINNSSPSHALHITTSGAGQIRIADGTRAAALGSTGSIGFVGSVTSGQGFAFYAGNSERMRIDSSGNVGIGTSSPAEEFVVRADAPSIQLESSNASGRNYGFQANNDGKFHAYDATAGVNRITLDSSGNVGIGTTSPSRNLTVSNGTNAIISVQNSGQSTEGVFNAPSGGTINLGTTGSYDLTLSTNSTERMRIDSSGNVGIGTTSPHQALDIGGTTTSLIKFTPSSYGTGATDGAQIGVNFGGLDVWQYENNYLRFGTNNTERMRIDSSGNVGIGTSSPDALLEIESSAGGTSFSINNTGTSGRQYILQSTSSSSSIGGGKFAIYDGDAPAHRFVLDSSGNVGIGTTSPSRDLEVSRAGNAYIRAVNSTNSVNIDILAASSAAFVGPQSNHPLAFQTNNTERARIDSSGRLLVGTTTEGQSNADDLTVASSGHTGITIRSGTANNGSLFFSDGTSGDAEFRGYVQYNHSDNKLVFGTNAAERMRIDSSGHITPGANGTQDLGSTSKRFANLYTSDLDLSNEAKGGNDVDGTWGAYTIQEGEEDLFLINKRSGKKYRFMLQEVS